MRHHALTNIRQPVFTEVTEDSVKLHLACNKNSFETWMGTCVQQAVYSDYTNNLLWWNEY